ncbi:MAG: hypothetical protein AAF703_17225 [Cyanobacteria bacterium P01_D01_bin.105]
MKQGHSIRLLYGLDFLRDRPTSIRNGMEQIASSSETLSYFVIEVPKHGIKAKAQEIDGEFVVLADSFAREV